MKKFLLFLSTVFLSLFIINNEVFAQTEPIRQPPFVEYPIFILKVRFWGYDTPIRENANTYEFDVDYYIDGVLINTVENNDYFFINDIGIGFRKGLDRRTNTFELIEVFANTETNTTWFTLRVTVLKSILNDNYPDPLDYYLFFLYDTALYIFFPDADSVDSYNRGYSDGYSVGFDNGLITGWNEGYNDGRTNGFNEGYNVGFDNGWQTGYNAGHRTGYNEAYDEGYDDGLLIGEQSGYERGFNDGYDFAYDLGYNDGVNATQQEAYQLGYDAGYKDASNTAISKFTSSLHVWIVPAIIVIVVAGIFVGYRRERHWNE